MADDTGRGGEHRCRPGTAEGRTTMVTVAAGDRLVLRTAAGTRLAVRALHATELVGPWRVRVLAPAGRVAAVAGGLELAGAAGGTVPLPARLALADGALGLEAGGARRPAGALSPVAGEEGPAPAP